MKSKYLLSTLLILPITLWAAGSNPTPLATSALQFQQLSDTKVAVGDNVISFFTSAAEQMTLTANGQLGIGTASPSNNLEVHSSSLNRISAIVDSNVKNGLQIKRTGASHATDWEIYNPESSSDLRFYNTEDRLTISSGGNVGIGTDSPAAKLQVSGGDVLLQNPTSGYPTLWLKDVAGTNTLRLDYNSLIGDGSKFYIRSNGSNELVLNDVGGNVGIGTSTPSHKLHVNGNAHASTYSADSPPSWPDYVFEDSYELKDIAAVEKYIERHSHLPEIPSAAEVKENGVDLVSMQAKLLQKIEELTLYVIEQNKKIERLEQENQTQHQEIQNLKR